MGSADVIPGVSGGTMALIMGIYEELIRSIRSFDMRFLRLLLRLKIREAFEHTNWIFLFSLGLGILSAIFTLSNAIRWILEHQPVFIWSFFFGLVSASAITIARDL